MALTLQHMKSIDILLSTEEAELLWNETIKNQNYPDDDVTVRFVSVKEITELNTQYRKKAKPTNVLTFSYGEGEHDIALCLDVAKQESQVRGMEQKDYVALLLVHAFLHATGLDHESSAQADIEMKLAEKDILKKAGFTVNNL